MSSQLKAISALCVAAALIIPASAPARAKPDPLLRNVAGQITHGWDEDWQPLPQLEARWRAGERLYISCGTTVRLAQRILRGAGIRSRLVATLTRQPFNGFDDGHTLLEVRKGDRWVVYDLDNNRQPVDARGRGMRLVDWVRQQPRRFRMLADDQAVALEQSSNPSYTQSVYADLNRWYDRVLGIPLIYVKSSGSFVFHDRDRARAEGYSSGYKWMRARAWRRLIGPR